MAALPRQDPVFSSQQKMGELLDALVLASVLVYAIIIIPASVERFNDEGYIENQMNQKIIDRIIKKTGVPNLVETLGDRVSLGELQSLLMKVYGLKTAKLKPHGILEDYKTNRFVKPSDVSPIVHRQLDLKLFSSLPAGFEVMELSPLTPIGTSSVLTTVSQNNVVTTIRNTEVAADTTNILALECAKRRQALLRRDSKSFEDIKLCASQRQVRCQPFEGRSFSAHFCVVALCTAGRDTGNDGFEKKNLAEHIGFYLQSLGNIIEDSQAQAIQIKLFCYHEADDSPLVEMVKNQFQRGRFLKVLVEKNSEFGKDYYQRLRFMISVMNHDHQEFAYIDGGFADWTSQLLSSKKERLLTSGIGTDFLLRTMKLKPLLYGGMKGA